MPKLRRAWGLLILPVFAAGFLLFAPWRQPVRLRIYAYDNCGGCFQDVPCMPCATINALNLTYFQILEEKGLQDRAEFTIINTLYEAGRQSLREELDRLGIDREGLEMPLVVWNEDRWYAGEGAAYGFSQDLWGNPLRGLFAGSGGVRLLEENEMVYFYSELCGDCMRAEGYIAGIEETIREAGITLTRSSVDDAGGYELLSRYMEAYAIGHKEAAVPYLFWGKEAYHGSDPIRRALQALEE